MTAATSLVVVQPSVHTPSDRPGLYDSSASPFQRGAEYGRVRRPFHEFQDPDHSLRRSDRRADSFSGRRATDRPPRDFQPAHEPPRQRANAANFDGFASYSSPFLTQFIAQQMMPQDETKASGFAEEATAAYQAAGQRAFDDAAQFLPLTLET